MTYENFGNSGEKSQAFDDGRLDTFTKTALTQRDLYTAMESLAIQFSGPDGYEGNYAELLASPRDERPQENVGRMSDGDWGRLCARYDNLPGGWG